MRVYIAAPMSDVIEDNNRAAFVYAWGELMKEGIDAVSPHFLENVIEVKTRARMGRAAVYRHVLPTDVFAISSCNACLALPGWDDSVGCRFEKNFADICEIPWVAPVSNGSFIPCDPLDPDLQEEILGWCVAEGIRILKEHALARTVHP